MCLFMLLHSYLISTSPSTFNHLLIKNIPYQPHFISPASNLHTFPGPPLHLHPSLPHPLSPLFQSPSIWASESGRAPDPPMRLGCEGAEPSRPGRGGASAAWGGAGLWLPGPSGRAFPSVLHPWSSRSPGGLRGRGLPAAQRAGPEQRCEVQAPVGGTVSL